MFSGTRVAKIIKAVVRGTEYRLDAAGIGKIQVTVDLVDRDGEISLDLVRIWLFSCSEPTEISMRSAGTAEPSRAIERPSR